MSHPNALTACEEMSNKKYRRRMLDIPGIEEPITVHQLSPQSATVDCQEALRWFHLPHPRERRGGRPVTPSKIGKLGFEVWRAKVDSPNKWAYGKSEDEAVQAAVDMYLSVR